MSVEEFTKAVEPVVEEYEKSISALESQLSLTRAALTHSEDAMRQKAEKALFETQVNESNAQVIGDLKARLAKLAERESLTEGYIYDLEVRLKSSTEKSEQSTLVIVESKKEIAKYREVESNSERYIKDLEARLSKSVDIQTVQKAHIETLERDLHRREKAYEDLERRLALLDTTEQHKQLLCELDDREVQLLRLQRDLDEAKAQTVALQKDGEKVKYITERASQDKEGLQSRLENLEQKATSNGTSPSESVIVPLQNIVEEVEPSEVIPDRHTGSADREALLSQLRKLQKTHDRTLWDPEILSAKHKDSLQALEDLQQQKDEQLLKSSSSSDTFGSAPSSPKGSSNDNELEELQDSVRSYRLPSNNSYITPSRSSRTSRRSMPVSPQGSFLGRSPVPMLSTSHLRSVSLSQELSLAHSLNAGTGLSPGAMSPRSISPVFAKRNSLLSIALPTPPASGRSNESLLQEVRKLQQTLHEREDEIRGYEAKITRSRPIGVTYTAASDIAADEGIQRNDENSHPDPFSPTTETSPAFDLGTPSIGNTNAPPTALSTEEQILRLDNLMLSMAKKEGAHREQVDDLEDQLFIAKRQHEEIKKLSEDQVVNMSTEITALREHLSTASLERGGLQQEASALQSRLDNLAKDCEEEIAEQKREHEVRLAEIEKEHLQVLQQRDDQYEQALEALRKEHATLLHQRHKEYEHLALQMATTHIYETQRQTSEHETIHENAKLEYEKLLLKAWDEHREAMQRIEEVHTETSRRLEQERASFLDLERTSLIERLNAEHNDILTAREANFKERAQLVQDEHTSLLSSKAQEHSEVLLRLRQEHKENSQQQVDESAADFERIRKEGRDLLEEADETHQEQISRLSAQHKSEQKDLEAKHAEALRISAKEHEERMGQLRESHQAEKSQLEGANSILTNARDDAERRSAERELEHQDILRSLSPRLQAALQLPPHERHMELALLRANQDTNVGARSDRPDACLVGENEQSVANSAASNDVRYSAYEAKECQLTSLCP